MTIVFAGAGALGSLIAMLVCDQDSDYLVIDDDRIDGVNVYTGTSAYSVHHIGALKAVVLSEMIYRKCEAIATPMAVTLAQDNRHLLAGGRLVIDTFDNGTARALTCELGVPTVHVGVTAGRVGAVEWDEGYTPPTDEYARGDNPVCTHALGREVLQLTATLASAIVRRFLETGEQRGGWAQGLRTGVW